MGNIKPTAVYPSYLPDIVFPVFGVLHGVVVNASYRHVKTIITSMYMTEFTWSQPSSVMTELSPAYLLSASPNLLNNGLKGHY